MYCSSLSCESPIQPASEHEYSQCQVMCGFGDLGAMFDGDTLFIFTLGSRYYSFLMMLDKQRSIKNVCILYEYQLSLI